MSLGENIQPKITAEWARKQSKEILSDKVTEQLTKVLNAVDYAIKNDHESAPAHGYIHDKVKVILEGRGFKLEHIAGHDQRDPDYTKITW
jgi:hypothetical protein